MALCHFDKFDDFHDFDDFDLSDQKFFSFSVFQSQLGLALDLSALDPDDVLFNGGL